MRYIQIVKMNHIYSIDMRYIIANTNKVRENSTIDIRSRNTSTDGFILLNDKDLCSVKGDTEEEKLLIISGMIITHTQAIYKLSKKNFK